ncbi:putative gustatory receptor 59f [Calliphora vicina]|uniref:putative gustatory receptor 59f n=1 Tax=Calliphora vicina TaxID=7373 RepID=UPI00325ABF13
MKLFKKTPNKSNPLNFIVKVQNDKEQKGQQMEKQLYKISKDFLIISQLFISAPMGIHKPRSNIQRKDLILYRLHVIWCLSIYTFLAFCVYDEYTLSNIELPTIQKPLYFSEYLVYLIHLLELIRIINFRREMYWKFQMFILDLDRTLLEMKIRINYGDIRRFLRQHMALIVLHFIATIIIGYFYNDGKILNFLRTNTVYILPNVIIHISLVQYYALLFVVYKRGEKLYFLLEKLLNTSSSNEVWKFRHQLHLIRSLFAKLEEFTKSVNDHFSISILLVYFGSFINLSVNVFLLYKYLNSWGTSNPAWTIYSFAWAFMHVGKMFLILYYNQNIQNMKSKATVLLSSLKFKHQTVETTIRLFILQLMSDTRSNFVCGIAALNMNFITSVLVAISALFIFLVQYDITYEALTKTHNSGRPNT